MSNSIEIYTKRNCPYCDRAKDFFKKKSLNFKEISIDNDEFGVIRSEMIQRSKGCMTVPQIFINDCHIGGSDDLLQLDANGKLDNLIRS